MARDLLIAIDETFAARSRTKPVQDHGSERDAGESDVARADPAASNIAAVPATHQTFLKDRPIWLQLFLVVQFMWGALMFIPDAQQYRGYIRALPYLSSLGLLALFFSRPLAGPRPRANGLLI